MTEKHCSPVPATRTLWSEGTVLWSSPNGVDVYKRQVQNGHETNIEIAPDYRFREGDVLVVIGKIKNIDRMENDC